MGSTGGQKDINELKRLVIANGFRLVPNGNGHMKLISKKGAVVTDKDGPVIISSTASDHRARDMHVKRLMGVNALKEDPWKPQKPMTDEQKKKGRPDPTSPEMRQRRREAELQRSKEREENTLRLRGRIEPFVTLIGGWDKKGVQTELARTCRHFLVTRGRVEAWGTDDSAAMNAHTLKKGGTLSDRSVAAWNLFMDEIDRSGDSAEARRNRYFELVREAAGLAAAAPSAPKPGPQVAAAPPPPSPAPPPVVDDQDAEVVKLVKYVGNGYRTPTLALEALAHMDTSTDEARKMAVKIASDILDMEIRAVTNGYTGVKVGA